MHDAFAENASGSQRDTAAPQFKLVPVEPTTEMLAVATAQRRDHLHNPTLSVHESAWRVWKAMLAASPTAPPPTQPEGHEALSDERIDAIFNDNHNPQESPWVNWRRFARAIESAVKGE
jgi:hypothetical protein